MEPNFITKETIFVLVVQVSFDIRFLGLSIGFHLDLPGVARNSILSPRAIFKKLLAKIDCTIKITEMFHHGFHDEVLKHKTISCYNGMFLIITNRRNTITLKNLRTVEKNHLLQHLLMYLIRVFGKKHKA